MPDGQNKLYRPVIRSREKPLAWVAEGPREDSCWNSDAAPEWRAAAVIAAEGGPTKLSRNKKQNKTKTTRTHFTLSDVCCAQLNRFWVRFIF